LVRNAARAAWTALNTAWVPPHAFGTFTDPSAGLNGVDPAGLEAEARAGPVLDWGPLWRVSWVLLDLLDAIGRQKIEAYFGHGVPEGVVQDM
jgi:hypothetical protein